MIKSTLLFLSILIGNYSLAQHDKHTESENKLEQSFTASLAVPYSFEIKSIGANARLYYNIGEHICFGPEASYFKKGDISILDFNFVGHYIFEIKHFGFYPLTGINYTKETEPLHKEDAFGFVFGAGVHKGFNKLTVFGEYSHVFSVLKDDFITLGLMYHFK